MVKEVVLGASYVLRGAKLLKLKGIKRYVVIPALINTFLFAAAIWYGFTEFSEYLDQVLPSWLDALKAILKFLFFIVSSLIVFFTFTIVANIFGAPFNGVLSEKIEEHLTQQKVSDNEGYLDLLRGARIGISNEIKKLFYIAIRALPLLIFLLPGLNIFAAPVFFIFGGWMLCIEYLDYPMGNRNYAFKQQLSTIKQKRFLCLGLGLALMLMTITPIVNFFAMPVGVAAATALWVDHLKQTTTAIDSIKKLQEKN